MAWITSATNGKAAGNAHWRVLQVGLLIAHLVLLVVMLFDRPTADAGSSTEHGVAAVAPELVTAPGAAASLALVTGLLMVIAMLSAGKSRPVTVDTIADSAARAVSPAPLSPQRSQPALTTGHDGLLARLNHDLRTPLNAIIGFADLMRSETFGPLGNDRYRAYAAHMQTCGQDLLRATESTLAMATLLTDPNSSDSDVVDLAGMVDEAWSAVRGQCGTPAGGRPLQMIVPPDLLVRGNRAALMQSMVNLLGHAGTRAGSEGSVQFGAVRDHGRVDAWITVSGVTGAVEPRTGCRSPAAASGTVDELALGLSQTLLGYQGVALTETCNRPDRWTVVLSLEDAAQADLFAADRSSARSDHRCLDYSPAFFAAAGASRSRSA